MINNKLIIKKIKKYKEKKILKHKANEYQKIEREIFGPEFIEKSKNNLSNISPENKIIKSGLLSLKEKISKKRSQDELPINSYIKKPSDEKYHQVSNSNPKIVRNNNILKNISLKNANNLLKKSNKRSLFETNKNIKKEKTKSINHNQTHKKIMDSLDKNINNKINKKIISGGIKIKKINKIKKNILTKKNKIDINDEILLDIKNNNKKYSTKNTNTNTNAISIINLNNSTINETHHNTNINTNAIKNKFIIKDNKNKLSKEKNNIHNKINKSEIYGDEHLETMLQISDNNLKKHISEVTENLGNIINKNIKSSKNERYFPKFSKLIEIDISKKGINPKKRSFHHEKNPFNANNEEKRHSHSFLYTSYKEIKSSKIVNKKNIKQKINIKKNSNKSNNSIIDKIGDN